MSEAHHPVVILYEYPLLGEGIAKYLRAQLGVETPITSGDDLEAVTAALALGPAVVIFELSDRLRQLDLAALAPHADLIDVSTVVAQGPVDSSGVAALELNLQASVIASPSMSRPRLAQASLLRRRAGWGWRSGQSGAVPDRGEVLRAGWSEMTARRVDPGLNAGSRLRRLGGATR